MNLFSQNKFFRGSVSCTTSILGTVGLSAIAFMGVVKPVEAASISFIPPGSQLDRDQILDIETKAGDSQNFVIQLNLGANEFVDNFKSVTVGFSWDNNELEKPIAIRNSNPNFSGGISLFEASSQGVLTLGNMNLNKSFPQTLDLGTIIFSVKQGLKNDGQFDFKLNGVLTALLANDNNVTNLFVANQEVEVQPVPEPMTILGTVLAFGFGGLFRKKYLSKSSL